MCHTVDFPKVDHVAIMFTIDTHSIGTSCVSKFLRDNCTLQVLSMNGNAVGDNGVSVIMDGLKCNSSLTELWLEECGFSVKGMYTGQSIYSLRYKLKIIVFPHQRKLNTLQ